MRKLIIVATGIVIIFAQCGAALALSKNTDAGETACIAWCYAHNKADNNQNKCILRCIDYYDPPGTPMPIEADPAIVKNGVIVGIGIGVGPSHKPTLSQLTLPRSAFTNLQH